MAMMSSIEFSHEKIGGVFLTIRSRRWLSLMKIKSRVKRWMGIIIALQDLCEI